MRQVERAALGAAVSLSVVSIGDAVLRAVSNSAPPWDDEAGVTWATVALGLLAAVTFALLSVVLVRHAQRIDEGSGARRWTRRLLVGDLVVLAAGFLVMGAVHSDAVAAVAGSAFLLMFLLGTVLGVMLLRDRRLRMPAVFMAAPLPVIGLTLAVEALAPGWGHPAYAETCLYVGIALLGRTAADAGPSRPDRFAPVLQH